MEIYDDIINMEHHVSTKHPQMSLQDRSAQFAPFAAWVGFDDMVEETARIVDKKIEVNEEQKEKLDLKLKEIKQKINLKPIVTITYFVPDKFKEGGKYVTVTEKIKKIDEYKKQIILENNIQILINEILEIE